ncbi:MAG: hypothetical protein HQK54_14545 [Oligoflexales bacterium]|nr:hypothetical protein [Oligoflexales bacterium]
MTRTDSGTYFADSEQKENAGEFHSDFTIYNRNKHRIMRRTMHSSNTQKESFVSYILKALENDMPLYQVVETVEKAVIGNALERHDSCLAVYTALKIPKTSFFEKRKRYFT